MRVRVKVTMTGSDICILSRENRMQYEQKGTRRRRRPENATMLLVSIQILKDRAGFKCRDLQQFTCIRLDMKPLWRVIEFCELSASISQWASQKQQTPNRANLSLTGDERVREKVSSEVVVSETLTKHYDECALSCPPLSNGMIPDIVHSIPDKWTNLRAVPQNRYKQLVESEKHSFWQFLVGEG